MGANYTDPFRNARLPTGDIDLPKAYEEFYGTSPSSRGMDFMNAVDQIFPQQSRQSVAIILAMAHTM